MRKITIKDIYNYIDGNVRSMLSELGLCEKHIKEQIAYRLLKCKDTCLVNKKCQHCGCNLPERAFSSLSCNNGEIFPDLMNEKDWIEFKKDNNID
jgi:hypothetical protein